jgi:5-methyltetrahydropteroyltriglutamate--homocysteine methyltransferase
VRHSTDRILVSHAGALPPTPELTTLLEAGSDNQADYDKVLPGAVAEVVEHQVAIGHDIINDGELSKRGGFSNYLSERMSGIERHPLPDGAKPRSVNARDRRMFPGFYDAGLGAGARRAGRSAPAANASNPYFVTEPLVYTGAALIAADIARLKAASEGLDVELYLPGIAPGTVEHWLWNDYYASEEEFLFALADVLHEEFKAITDAGIILQVDDPDLPDGWQMFPDMTVAEYHRYAELRVEAINHAIRGLPEELVRLHICWGSQHGPHADDIPLAEILDAVLKVNAQCLSVEAANPTHEHEWLLWEDHKLPEGRILMPGVVGHATDLIEHPELVAQRLVRYAGLVGKENVIAGTDCGLAPRVGHAEIAWAKLDALATGALLASERLWK